MKPSLASLLRVPPLVSLQTYLSAVMLVATVPLALLVAYHVFNSLQTQHLRMQAELQRSAELIAATLVDERDAAGLPALLARSAPAGGAVTVRDAAGQLLARAGPLVDDGYAAAGTVAGKGWQVGVTLPRAQIDDAERRMLLAALATITACLLLGLALATLAARRVTDPLRELATHGPGGAMAQPDHVKEVAGLREALAQAQASQASAQAGLQRKAAEFEALFASTPIGLAFLRGGETVHNAAMDRLVGTPAQAAAQTLWRDDAHPLEPAQQPLQRAVRSGCAVQPQELALRLPDGSMRHLLVQAVPLHDDADGPAALASAVDITERKQAEQRMLEADRQLQETQRLIDLAQEAGELGFFHIDENGAGWTPGLSRLFGFDGSVPPALRLADLLERVHEDDRDAVEQGLRDMAAGQRERGTLEYRVTLTDSAAATEQPATRWLSSRVQMGFGADGRPLRLIGATLNVNEQKSLELERAALAQMERRARIDAEDANRAKDEFLAMLGHELRNPLGAIASASEVLAQLGASPPAKAAALAESARAIIARQTRQLARLVDDLLDIGRVISGKVTMSRHRFEMAALVQRAVENFRLTGSADRHELVQRLVPVWIEADATRIEQVVNNLLGNALKYTPAGRRIELQLGIEGQHQAVLRVTDHGDGISPRLLPHIFDLFVQGERLLDRGAGGLGVGLTLVRRLVEMHGGTVTVDSSPQGSTFTVRLPAALDQPAPGTPDEQQGRYHASAHGVPPCRVLVIEDNEDARTTLCTMLELDGHSVSTAADGREGLSLLLGERPDVAVVDIGLPGLSGFELARESRRSGYAGRLLALSGYGSDADVAQSLRHGFDAHLAKPVDPQRLRDLLAANGW